MAIEGMTVGHPTGSLSVNIKHAVINGQNPTIRSHQSHKHDSVLCLGIAFPLLRVQHLCIDNHVFTISKVLPDIN